MASEPFPIPLQTLGWLRANKLTENKNPEVNKNYLFSITTRNPLQQGTYTGVEETTEKYGSYQSHVFQEPDKPANQPTKCSKKFIKIYDIPENLDSLIPAANPPPEQKATLPTQEQISWLRAKPKPNHEPDTVSMYNKNETSSPNEGKYYLFLSYLSLSDFKKLMQKWLSNNLELPEDIKVDFA